MLDIKFDRLEIAGIKHPLLTVKGMAIKEVKKLMIVTNENHKIFIDLPELNCPVKFLDIEEPLKLSQKYAIYYVLSDGTNKLIKEIPYSLGYRIANKISGKKEQRYVNKQIKKSKKEMVYNDESFEIFDDEAYNQWIEKHEKFSEYQPMEYEPLISFVMPVYNVDPKYLTAVLDSMLRQTYTNFEICIADDCSSNQSTINVLKEYESKYDQIKVVYRKKNGHISNATNSALEIADGEFIALVDNDDLVSPHALNEVVKILNKDKSLDFIYSDEDKIDQDGHRSAPVFKPEYSPMTLIGGNYLCHFSVIRKSIVNEVGNFNVGVEGAQDFDLFLRVLQKTNKIAHIPYILYHWRMIDGSTAQSSSNKNYAGLAGKKALEGLYGDKKEILNIIHTHYLTLEKQFNKPIKLIIYNFDQDKWDKSKEHLVLNYDLIIIKENMFISKVIEEQPDDSIVILMDGNATIETLGYLAFLCEPLTYNGVQISCGVNCDNKYILNSSYNILTNDNLLVDEKTPITSYGQYGSLAIPKNVSMTNFDVVAFNKRAINYDDEKSIPYNIANNVLRNLSLNNQIVCTRFAISKKNEVNELTKAELGKLKDEYSVLFTKDKYYSDNFSKKNIYMIDR